MLLALVFSAPILVAQEVAFIEDRETYRNQVQRWLNQLGSATFSERKRAEENLSQLPFIPWDLLKAATWSKDPEVRIRARELMQAEETRRSALETQLRNWAYGKPAPSARMLLARQWIFAPVSPQTFSRAVSRAAEPDDAPALEDALGQTNAWIRIAACEGLALIDAVKVETFKPLLTDEVDRVRLHAAVALGNAGTRQALDTLVALLKSNPFIRRAAVRALRQATGQQFGFDPSGKVKARAEAVQAWKTWMDGNRDQFAWKLAMNIRDQEVLLANGTFHGWKAVLNGVKQAPGKHFSLTNGVVHFDGAGDGYLYWDQKLTDFELELDWRWPNHPGDAGVFLQLSDLGKRRPSGLEVQLLSNKEGDYWQLGNDALANPGGSYIPRQHTISARPPGQWNRMKIIVRGGRIQVEVNGQKTSEIAGRNTKTGNIALQVENTAIEFRRLLLKRFEMKEANP